MNSICYTREELKQVSAELNKKWSFSGCRRRWEAEIIVFVFIMALKIYSENVCEILLLTLTRYCFLAPSISKIKACNTFRDCDDSLCCTSLLLGQVIFGNSLQEAEKAFSDEFPIKINENIVLWERTHEWWWYEKKNIQASFYSLLRCGVHPFFIIKWPITLTHFFNKLFVRCSCVSLFLQDGWPKFAFCLFFFFLLRFYMFILRSIWTTRWAKTDDGLGVQEKTQSERNCRDKVKRITAAGPMRLMINSNEPPTFYEHEHYIFFTSFWIFIIIILFVVLYLQIIQAMFYISSLPHT